MAENRMMTPADVVAKAMAGEHGDLLRDAVAMVVREFNCPAVRPRVASGVAGAFGLDVLREGALARRGN